MCYIVVNLNLGVIKMSKKKEELSDYFKKVAETYNKDEEYVEKEFNKLFAKVSASPSMRLKTEPKRIKRTRAKMHEFMKNIKRNGKEFVFIPFGHTSEPRDWNGKEIKTIKAQAAKGLIPQLLREEKIMYKNTPSGRVAVSDVKDWGKRKVYIKDGKKYLKEIADSQEVEEWFVIDGTELKPGDTNVIPRENKIYVGKGKEHINFKWSKQLLPNYSAEVWGFGYPKDDPDNTRLCHFRIRNSQGNPFSANFFFKKYPAFRPYEADFGVVLKDGIWELTYARNLDPRNAEIVGVSDENIDDVIESNLEEIRELYKREGTKAYVPPFIYIDGIEEYHKSTCIMDGTKPKKSPKGWDLTGWGKYAILSADFERGTYATDPKRSNYYLFSDGDVDFKTGGFGDISQFNAKPIQPATPVICTITTSRGPSRYDYKTKKRVIDPENGDINLNVNTIRELPRTEIDLDDDEDFEEDDE